VAVVQKRCLNLLFVFGCSVILSAALSACGALDRGASAHELGVPTQPPRAAPLTITATQVNTSVPLNLDDAQRVAADFLHDWTVDAYDAMYALLTVNSRDAFNRQVFQKFYTDAEETMTLLPQGKSFTLTNLIQQDSGAQIAYDMSFKTKVFGDFTDSG